MGVRVLKIVKDVIPSIFRTGQIVHMQECLPANTTVVSITYNNTYETLEIVVENDCWNDATLDTIDLVMEGHSDRTHSIVERGAHIIDNPVTNDRDILGSTAEAVPDDEEDMAVPQLRGETVMDEVADMPSDSYYGTPPVAQLAGDVEAKAKKLRKKEVTMHSCACPYCSNNVKVLVSDREPTLMCTG